MHEIGMYAGPSFPDMLDLRTIGRTGSPSFLRDILYCTLKGDLHRRTAFQRRGLSGYKTGKVYMG
jgi:hypothetical protein